MTPIQVDLGALAAPVAESTARLERDHIVSRIAAGDYTVWKPEPTEITNRRGWLTIADRMRAALPEIQRLVDDVQLVTPPPAEEVPIPDRADTDASHMTFGVLKVAQSLGDRPALLDRGCRVLRVDADEVPRDIARITTLVP